MLTPDYAREIGADYYAKDAKASADIAKGGAGMRDIRQVLQQGPLLFDGGMGTYFSQKNHSPGSGCELANLSQPELIGDIHREYLEAGAQAIKTNSFALNRPALQGGMRSWPGGPSGRAGELAAQAAAPFDAFVFADIGPVTALSPDQAAEEYRWVADRFLELGARHFLFETNATAAGLREAAEYIRAQAPRATSSSPSPSSPTASAGRGVSPPTCWGR